MVSDWMESARAWATAEHILPLAQAAGLVLIGILLARTVGRLVERIGRNRFSAQQTMILRRILFYGILCLFLLSALHPFVDLRVLLGAAGILTVALGFAAQTSVSNVISGLFLLGERSFVVGDLIRAEGTLGFVESIDLLSVKLRTFDNLYVRLPNENLLKAKIENLTRFPIRRIDLQVGVAYKEETGHVREVLSRVADRNPLCLDEPPPLILFRGFGDSSLDYQVSVWCKTENWLQLKTAIQEEIKEAFDAEGIEIPFPHRTLYTGAVTDPMPVRIVSGSDEEQFAAETESSPLQEE